MDGARDGSCGQPLRAEAADELGQVGLAEVEKRALRPLRMDNEAGQVAAVRLQRVRRERALDAQVVEVVRVHALGIPARARAPGHR